MGILTHLTRTFPNEIAAQKRGKGHGWRVPVDWWKGKKGDAAVLLVKKRRRKARMSLWREEKEQDHFTTQ